MEFSFYVISKKGISILRKLVPHTETIYFKFYNSVNILSSTCINYAIFEKLYVESLDL